MNILTDISGKKSQVDYIMVYRKWKNSLYIWVKVFRNGSVKVCGRQPLKNDMVCLGKSIF